MVDISSGAASESNVWVVSVVVGVLPPLPLRWQWQQNKGATSASSSGSWMGGCPKRSNPNNIILQGFAFAPDLDFRYPPLLLPLPGFECNESVSPRPLSKGSARRPCSTSGHMWGMQLTGGLYGFGHSSPDDDEFGCQLLHKPSEEERGQRQVMRKPNAIWVVSVPEKSVVTWQESLLGWGVEGNLKGTWL